MANRYTNQFMSSLEKKVVDIFARVSFGASGVPTLSTTTGFTQGATVSSNPSKGVLSITQNGTGEYTFVFGGTGQANTLDCYQGLLMATVAFQTGSTTIPAAPLMNVVTNSIATAGTCSLQVQLYSAAGTAANPASGEIAKFAFTFTDSSAP